MQATDNPFSKIISVDQGAREHYHVPKYQREYTWGLGQWEQLYQDIDENDRGYFFGSIICTKKNDPQPGEEQIYDVIDGQQRMTTLSLLMMAIYKQLKKISDDLSFEDDEDGREFNNTITSLRNKLIKKKRDYSPNEVGGFKDSNRMAFCRVQPSSQHKNLDDYLYNLSELQLINERQRLPYCVARPIYKAFVYFQEVIPEEKNALVALVEKINELIFVFITADSQSSAFTLFESLNNRGVPLSPIDIIKNTMLAEMEMQHSTSIDESYERWQKILGCLPESDDQERFLRHFYNAFKIDEKIKVEGVTRATRSKVIYIYEKLIKKRDAKAIFEKLQSTAKTYGFLLTPNEEHGVDACNNLEELNKIGAAPSYQVLLYLFSLPESSFEENDFLTKTIELICMYYVRRNITDIPSTRNLDTAHIDLIEACNKKIKNGERLTLAFFEKQLLSGKGEPASLEIFREKLEGNIYTSNSWMTRYLLVRLNTTYHTREYSPNLWERDDKGRLVWTIEHVFPEGDKIPEPWVQMIAEGDINLANEIRESHVHRLGNLTLSGYNSNLSNASFNRKQELDKGRTFLGHKINIGYKNGLPLNDLKFDWQGNQINLANAPSWKKEMIEQRTNVMSASLIDLLKFSGEE